MKQAVEDESDQSFIKNATEYGIQKLTTYFELIVTNPPVSTCCVATALNPQLRLLWFKDKWAAFPMWHKKAENSLKEVFQRYLDAEEDEDEMPEIRRRKLPGGNHHDELFENTMTVNLQLQTGHRSHKRARSLNELQKYFDDIYTDIPSAAENDLIFGDPSLGGSASAVLVILLSSRSLWTT